jgi:hemerythrin-like domain-containing protein
LINARVAACPIFARHTKERRMSTTVLSAQASAPSPQAALDFILFEHMKHREMCKALDRLAESPDFDAKEVARLAEFIRVDLTMHVCDEEEDFFPLLQRHCLPEDEIGVALERMSCEHAEDRDLCARVRIALLVMITERKPAAFIPNAAETLRAFAQSQRNHMALENAVLIPLARRRLSDEDVAALGARLAARRAGGGRAGSSACGVTAFNL